MMHFDAIMTKTTIQNIIPTKLFSSLFYYGSLEVDKLDNEINLLNRLYCFVYAHFPRRSRIHELLMGVLHPPKKTAPHIRDNLGKIVFSRIPPTFLETISDVW